MLQEMISQYLNNEYNFKPIQLVIVEHLTMLSLSKLVPVY